MIETSSRVVSEPKTSGGSTALVDRFSSLGAMRSTHRDLLKQRSQGGSELQQSIRRYLELGAALGRILGTEADRDDAQSMLDYWTASLCAEGHKAVDATLDDFDPAEADRLAQQAERMYASLPADQQQALRTVLLRLARTNERLQVGKSEAVRVETLYRLGMSAEEAARAIEHGKSVGLLYRIPGSKPEEDQLEIGSEAVLHRWPRFEQWQQEERRRLADRRQFTAAARLWASHDRDPGGLLGGAALEAVTQYHELSPLEEEFIRASRQFAQQQIASDLAEARAKLIRFRIWATVCLFFAALAIVFAGISRYQANRARQQTELAQQQTEFAQQQTEVARQQTEFSRRQAQIISRLSDHYLITLVLNLRTELRLSQELLARLDQEKLKCSPQQEHIIESYRWNPTELKDREVQGYLKPAPAAPGLSIGVQDHGSAGSICCVLTDDQGRRFVLTSGHLFTNLMSPQDELETLAVWQPSPVDGSGNRIGELYFKASYTSSAALATLRDEVAANNDLPEDMGRIVGIEDVRNWTPDQWAAVPEGNRKVVHLFGCGSGHQTGHFSSPIKPDSYLFRVVSDQNKDQPVSSPGDSGAPVLIKSAEREFILIGMLYRKGESGKESLVVPIDRVWDEVGRKYRLFEVGRQPKVEQNQS